MNYINEEIVLDFYLEQIDKDNVQFLVGRNVLKENIRTNILNLRNVKSIHEKIEISKKLWKLLFEAAMSQIDSDMRGYDELFKYFDEYVVFEELIFASDSFYRDHTIHCLWVYFLGEYLVKHEEFKCLFNNMNREMKKYIEIIESFRRCNLSSYIQEFEEVINRYNFLEYVEAMRCIAALTHDLGYPIKKIHKINNCIGKVLPYFSIKNVDEFNFNYNSIQTGFIEEFIRFMSINFTFDSKEYDDSMAERVNEVGSKVFDIKEINGSITIDGVKEEELLKLSKEELDAVRSIYSLKGSIREDVTARLRYLNDFEEYQHGIMSAFLLIKVVKAFRIMNFKYRDNVNIDLNEIDVTSFLLKSSILKAVSDHTSDGYQIQSLEGISEILTLVDELEEFSRISRANMNREFVREFCKTNLFFSDNTLNIEFIFDNVNIDNLDPERAFKGRCKRFLTLFNISKLDEKIHIKLSCIGKLPYNNNIYTLEIAHKYANITINDVEQNIPEYMKSREFKTKEMYAEKDFRINKITALPFRHNNEETNNNK